MGICLAHPASPGSHSRYYPTRLTIYRRHQSHPAPGVCRRAAPSDGLSYRGCTAQFFTFDLDLPVYPSMVITPGQSSISEGLEMRLEKLEITPSFTKAYLCYQKPSAADWSLSWENTILKIGEAQSRMTDYSLVLDEDYGMQERPEWASLPGRVRCVWVGFTLGHDNKPAKLSLAINGLDQSFPEMIPADQLQAARQALRQQGIEIDWVTFSGNGGGGAGPQITRKPEGMSDEEVLRLFSIALGYQFPATWTFTLEINPN